MAKKMNLGVLAILGLAVLFLGRRTAAAEGPLRIGNGPMPPLHEDPWAADLMPDIGIIVPVAPIDFAAGPSPTDSDVLTDPAPLPVTVTPSIVELLPATPPPMVKSITKPTEALSADELRKMDQQNDAMKLARDAGLGNLAAQAEAMKVRNLSAVAYQEWRDNFYAKHFAQQTVPVTPSPTTIEPVQTEPTAITAVPAQWLPGSWQYEYLHGLDEED